MSSDPTSALVPPHVDDCATSAPFLYLAMSSLHLLSTEAAVHQYVAATPGLLAQIQALSTAVSTAGVRVRDAGLIKDSFDERLHVYTPDEIWTFDLVVDLIAMLGTLDGVPDDVRATIVSNMHSLDDKVTSRTWKKELPKAADGPAQFRDLRAQVPHHSFHLALHYDPHRAW